MLDFNIQQLSTNK